MFDELQSRLEVLMLLLISDLVESYWFGEAGFFLCEGGVTASRFFVERE